MGGARGAGGAVISGMHAGAGWMGADVGAGVVMGTEGTAEGGEEGTEEGTEEGGRGFGER